MPTIAIVDDREHARESLMHLIEPSLPKGWACIAIEPFKSLPEYISFLLDDDNEVVAIVLDEKLDERATKAKEIVNYSGTKLAEFLRKRLKDFPIYLITSYMENLKTDQALFEESFDRTDFMKDVSVHVARMIRAGTRFSKTFEAELSELSRKSELLAAGHASAADKERVAAIREKLDIAFPLEEITTRAEWLVGLEASIKKLHSLSTDLSLALKKSKKRK